MKKEQINQIKKAIAIRNSYNALMYLEAATRFTNLSENFRKHLDFNFIQEEMNKTKVAKEILKTFAVINDIQKNSDDKHGFKTGFSFDSKQRGYAINIDVYDIDFKGQNNCPLAIIQVRLYEKRSKNGYANIRKNYFLIGRNENKNAFAHPIPSPLIKKWIDYDELGTAVKKAQNWIFKENKNILRQGDVALVSISQEEKNEKITKLNDLYEIESMTDFSYKSHFLTADEILIARSKENHKKFKLYALNAKLVHTKNQHKEIEILGWSKFIVGRREATWDFANPTID